MELDNIQYITQVGGWVSPYNQESIDVTHTAALGLSPWYSGCRFLSETLAKLPKQVYRDDEDGRVHEKKHPIAYILNKQMNDYASPTVTLETWYFHAVSCGNGYLYWDAQKEQLINLNPTNTLPFRVDGKKFYYLQEQKMVLDNTEVLHLLGLSYNGIVGLNPIELLYPTFKHLMGVQQFKIDYFNNGTHINGVIEVPAGISKEQIATMRETWALRYSGARGSGGGTPILPFGAKWVNTTASNEQSQLSEISKAGIDDVARILRLPPTILFQIGNAGAWGTVTALDAHVVKYSLSSWIEKTEDEFMKMFTTEELRSGYGVKIQTSSLTRDNPSKDASDIAKVNSGLLLVNEWREENGYDPLPGGDVPRINVSQSATLPAADEENTAEAAAIIEEIADEREPEDETEGETEPAAEDEADFTTVYAELVRHAAHRVEQKTLKALEHMSGKSDYMERKAKLAEQQAQMIIEETQPILATHKALTGRTVDVTDLAQKYRERLAGVTPDELFIFDLRSEIGGKLNG